MDGGRREQEFVFCLSAPEANEPARCPHTPAKRYEMVADWDCFLRGKNILIFRKKYLKVF